MKIKKLANLVMLLIVAVALSGCVAATRLIDYSDLKSDVKITQSIFLTATEAPKTIYIQIRNSSSDQNATEIFKREIVERLTASKYRIIDKPSMATYILQANIRYLGEWKSNMNLTDATIGAGAGALTGIGLTNSSNMGNLGTNAIGGAVIGATLGFIADAATKIKTEVITIDLQITEKTAKGEHKHSAGIAAKAEQLASSFKDEEATKLLLTTAAKQIVGIF